MFYVKQDPSGTAKRDFILMDEDGNEIDGSGHTGNGAGGTLATAMIVVSNVNGEFTPVKQLLVVVLQILRQSKKTY